MGDFRDFDTWRRNRAIENDLRSTRRYDDLYDDHHRARLALNPTPTEPNATPESHQLDIQPLIASLRQLKEQQEQLLAHQAARHTHSLNDIASPPARHATWRDE